MDYLTSPRRTLTEILEKAASCLGKAPMAGDGKGGSEEEGSGEDLGSDDDDFDAYYGGEDDDPDSVVHEKERSVWWSRLPKRSSLLCSLC